MGAGQDLKVDVMDWLDGCTDYAGGIGGLNGGTIVIGLDGGAM
jgi:hypothetical protein